jgi:DNA polymerase I-like protein with 3'-5' exonuclease and polymerase domains
MSASLPVLPEDDRATCASCDRLATGYLCRASYGPGDILWVYTQPESTDVPEPGQLDKEPGRSGAIFSVTNTARAELNRENPAYKNHRIRITYAAQCVPEDPDERPSARTLHACNSRVHEVIAETDPKLIVAFGATALKQLGIKEKHGDVRGRILEPEVTGLSAPLLVTFSEKAVAHHAGIYSTFKQDLRNGYARIERGTSASISLEELSKSYRLPSTMDEALAVVAEIMATPDNTVVSVDTETTSLHPEKEGARLIAFCFSWGPGLATTILFDHPYAPQDYLDRLHELQEAIRRLLASPKPKVLHNAKFDLKWIELKYKMPVANVVWCTLCGEHLLDEDKKGNYGLKALCSVWLPKFSGYEDHLHEFLKEKDLEPLQELAKTIASVSEAEYPEYLEALHEYRALLEDYIGRKTAYAGQLVQYEQAREVYKAQVEAYRVAMEGYKNRPRRPNKPKKPAQPRGAGATDADFSAYTTLLKGYEADLEAWTNWVDPEKPTKDFRAPARPTAPGARPKEPEDPRSKKEFEYMSDGGYEKIPFDVLQIYGAVDGDATRRLTDVQLHRLQVEAANAGLAKSPTRPLMKTHCIPATRTLGEMEYYGTRIDQNYLAGLDKKLTGVIDTAMVDLYAMIEGVSVADAAVDVTRATLAGEDPYGKSLTSAADLAKIVYEQGWKHPDGTAMPPVACLNYTKKTKKPSMAEKDLRPYIAYDDVPGTKDKVPRRESVFLDKLFLFRKATKARDTFLENLRVLSKRDGKIHTSFHLNGTGTGRLSSSNMNLQNVPKKLGGVNLKALFIPDSDDMVIVNADYKGAEVRVFTVYAKDPALIKALNEGLDMHSFFAHKVFKRPYEDYENRGKPESGLSADYRALLDKERTSIKRVVFGILYGAGEGKIAETIGIDITEARAIIALLFEMFPAIKDYIDDIKQIVQADKYVETVFGRRRRFPLTATSRHRSRAERQAGNFKIQSTSSDIVISQLCEIHQMIKSNQTWPQWGIHQPLHTYGVRLLLTVHDSIVLQWPKKLLPALEPWLTYYGETRVKEKYPWLPVPFKMDIEVGENYGEVMPVDKYMANAPPELFAEHYITAIQEDELDVELREDAFAS